MIMFWPLQLCDTHTCWVSHSSQSPTWCHPQSVLVTFGLDPTDWLASHKILIIQHTGVGLSPYPHSLGISGSVTSWLLPGSLPPTCRRLKNVRGYRSLLMITLLAQTLAVIQQLRHKPWTPTTTPRSWAVYLPSSMQWHWQSSWHLVTSGHVMDCHGRCLKREWGDIIYDCPLSRMDTRGLVQPVACFSWEERLRGEAGQSLGKDEISCQSVHHQQRSKYWCLLKMVTNQGS